MPKLPPAKKLANSVALILVARLCMVAFGVIGSVSVPALYLAAKAVYDEFVRTRVELSEVKIALIELKLSGGAASSLIAKIEERVTYLERQSRR